MVGNEVDAILGRPLIVTHFTPALRGGWVTVSTSLNSTAGRRTTSGTNLSDTVYHARVLEGVDSFKSAHMRALHFQKLLP